MSSVFPKIVQLGVRAEMDPELVKRIRLINTIATLCVPMALITNVYVLWSVPFSALVLALVLLMWVAVLLPPALQAFGRYRAARIGVCLLLLTSVTTLSYVLGTSTHIHFFLITGAILPYVYFLRSEQAMRIAFFVLSAVLFFYVDYQHPAGVFGTEPPLGTPFLIRTVNHVMLYVLLFALIHFFQRETRIQLDQNAQQELLLTRQNQQLTEKNRELEHFAYIASHDLNEPLRTVDGFIDIIKEEYHDPADENLNTYFTYIHNGLARMRTMIQHLLNYSRIGTRRDFQTIDPGTLLEELRADLHQLLQTHGAQLHVEPMQPVVALPILRQVFHNLLTNALKFQPPGARPRVTITQTEAPGLWQFCVADNGIGIPPEKRLEIFQMFRKLHRPSDYAGHGIGLTFCKRIVEVHGGRMWITSTVGAGSQFYFTLAKRTAAAVPLDVRISDSYAV